MHQTFNINRVSHVSQDCEGDQFRQLVHAMCPSIYGQEMVKVRVLSQCVLIYCTFTLLLLCAETAEFSISGVQMQLL